MRKKILIAEDNIDTVNALKIALENIYNWDIQPAYNGKDAIEIAIKQQPNLIILDIQLPIINGAQVYTELKMNNATKNIPIIILTANSDARYLFEDPNIESYFEKPISMETLIREIKRLTDND